MRPFSDFQYGFRSFRPTMDLVAVVSDRITRVFNKSDATLAAALDISKAFDRVWHAGLLHKLNFWLDYNAEKTQLVSFNWSSNTAAIDMKMNGSVF